MKRIQLYVRENAKKKKRRRIPKRYTYKTIEAWKTQTYDEISINTKILILI
jgi:hypothetical protein